MGTGRYSLSGEAFGDYAVRTQDMMLSSGSIGACSVDEKICVEHISSNLFFARPRILSGSSVAC